MKRVLKTAAAVLVTPAFLTVAAAGWYLHESDVATATRSTLMLQPAR